MFSSLSSFGNSPVMSGARARNTMLDWFFYDVDGLTPEERSHLVTQPNTEGSVLTVWPKGDKGDISIQKFDDHSALRAADGPILTRFTIAGVGSSDVGAAAFARTVANYHQCPVGAIVAGYGTADLMSEAMGGWFAMGGASRVMQMYQDALETQPQIAASLATLETPKRRALDQVGQRQDALTLVNLMMDPDRQIKSVYGHSKGCKSISSALEALKRAGQDDVIKRQKSMRIVTAGTVISVPGPFSELSQFLGELDWFGGMNSDRSQTFETIPGTWHHLNTTMPGHLDFRDILKSVDN